MRIRALAVFERVVHNCVALDTDHPERPTLEVDALMRAGDDDGPLLVPAPTFMALLGGAEKAQPSLQKLSDSGRVCRHQGIAHVSFPIWKVIEP